MRRARFKVWQRFMDSAAFRAAGASVMYLPPYSPDLNPIEKMFAKLKAYLRKAKARTCDALFEEIGKLDR